MQRTTEKSKKGEKETRERERDGEVTLDEWPCGPGIYIAAVSSQVFSGL